MEINRQWILKSRPAAWPTADNFALVETPVPDLEDGQILLRSRYLSVDPYMRGRLRDRASYAPPAALDEVMVGGGVGHVAATRNPKYAEGDIVECSSFGWQDYCVSDGRGLRKIDASLAPISTALGILGMPGLTAYFGVLDVLESREGNTVVVSGGAGAVGSTVGQIAKIHGCRAVGIAGSDEKIEWITQELGFDAGLNYKTSDNFLRGLAALCPQGIDGYFDNVGGPISDAALRLLNLRGRIAVCGQISMYNATEVETGPRLLWELIAKRARIEGFLIFDYADRYGEALQKMAGWLADGKLRYRETIAEGLEKTPEAFISMMRGANFGKMLVQVS